MYKHIEIGDNRIANPEVVGGILESLKCPVCLAIVHNDRDPVECTKCNSQVFCRECFSRCFSEQYKCP